jgi:metallo-beta-lactamase family protein
MILTFYGAAGTVTGSRHLLTFENKKRILLDCGFFQGKNSLKQNREFLFDAESVSCLIVSHAHLDHTGLIPLLIRNGFRGNIYCTELTRQLTELLLLDSLKIQSSESNLAEILFNSEAVENTLKRFKILEYNRPAEIEEGIIVTLRDAGHIPGSASVHIKYKEKGIDRTFCFTGDLGRYSNRILCPPQPQLEAETVICESTYGNSYHQSIETTEMLLEKIIRQICNEQKGRLLIPAFSIGRTQELIFSLNKLAEAGKLKDIPVFVDSPLSVRATEIIRQHPEYFNEQMQEYIRTDPDPFGFPGLKYIEDHEESQKLLKLDMPAVIVSSSGMMDAGRIVSHLKENIGKPECGILVTGYSAPGTTGHDIASGKKEIIIEGVKTGVEAEIFSMPEYSAHADYGDILKFLSIMNKNIIRNIFLVHGEKRTMRKLKNNLMKEGFGGIEIASHRMSYEV